MRGTYNKRNENGTKRGRVFRRNEPNINTATNNTKGIKEKKRDGCGQKRTLNT